MQRNIIEKIMKYQLLRNWVLETVRKWVVKEKGVLRTTDEVTVGRRRTIWVFRTRAGTRRATTKTKRNYWRCDRRGRADWTAGCCCRRCCHHRCCPRPRRSPRRLPRRCWPPTVSLERFESIALENRAVKISSKIIINIMGLLKVVWPQRGKMV